MTTKVEIADLARYIRTGYHKAAEAYRRDCEGLAMIRNTPGMAVHEADAFHNAKCGGRICSEYAQELGRLELLVTEHLPDLWPTLRLVGSGVRWHDDAAFDWPTAKEELRTIEAAALAAERAVGNEPNPTATGRNEARDKWIYEQCYKGTEHGTIIRRLKQKPKSWARIQSVQGIRGAVKRYCKRHNLAEPPKRQKGRKPHS